jgi:hypothetical protein
MCAAIPMLRVRSIVYCLSGAFADLFSITASICFPENKNAPRTAAFGAL